MGFFVNATVLSIAIHKLAITDAGGTLTLAVLAWAGFAATLSSWPAAFARWPWGLWLINNGAFLLIQIASASILTVWR